MYLLNRVPEHDCPAFLVLHITKCKPLHYEWVSFSDFLQLGEGCAVYPLVMDTSKQQSYFSDF